MIVIYSGWGTGREGGELGKSTRLTNVIGPEPPGGFSGDARWRGRVSLVEHVRIARLTQRSERPTTTGVPWGAASP